jgi:hypothetical protein
LQKFSPVAKACRSERNFREVAEPTNLSGFSYETTNIYIHNFKAHSLYRCSTTNNCILMKKNGHAAMILTLYSNSTCHHRYQYKMQRQHRTTRTAEDVRGNHDNQALTCQRSRFRSADHLRQLHIRRQFTVHQIRRKNLL